MKKCFKLMRSSEHPIFHPQSSALGSQNFLNRVESQLHWAIQCTLQYGMPYRAVIRLCAAQDMCQKLTKPYPYTALGAMNWAPRGALHH